MTSTDNTNGDDLPATPPSSPLPPSTPPPSSFPIQKVEEGEDEDEDEEVDAPTTPRRRRRSSIRRSVDFSNNPVYNEDARQETFAVRINTEEQEEKEHRRISRSASRMGGFASRMFVSFASRPNIDETVYKETDPSIQPVPFYSRPPKQFFPSPLPGYAPWCYKDFPQNIKDAKIKTKDDQKGLAPARELVSPIKDIILPTFEESEDYIQPEVGYEWSTMQNTQMTRLPFPNAMFYPMNPDPTYTRANPFTAYPYGVPAVEENEQVYTWEAIKVKQKRWLGCC
eukprot:GHVS01086854.1.p1 GENE.GHVS01086854.1~~GHVS01086854.1.p1  ORF type:complete len:283 (+),score=45.84 GHVS01086854.1:219-1067(+)